ncbi:hypothetical protein HK102_000247 [Quaeritorhiza haematococci]|nr:hypothetical protein HK102_000247 [Quaeritorhiza haematococci]
MSGESKEKHMTRDSYKPLNPKGVNITEEAKLKGEGTTDPVGPGSGGHGRKEIEDALGRGEIPRKRGSKMRDEKEYEELAAEVPHEGS